jgi:molecular chaperone DnaJ
LIHRTLYAVLELEPDASDETIKNSFKKLALRYHPDRNAGNSGAEQQFKDINRAHSVLSAQGQRQLYDEFGKGGLTTRFDPAAERNRRATIEFTTGCKNNAGGLDLEAKLVLGPREAVLGGVREITLSVTLKCASCEAGRCAVPCGACGGAGQIQFIETHFCQTCSGGGVLQHLRRTGCPTCRATGTIVSGATLYWCPTCQGSCAVQVRSNVACRTCAGRGKTRWLQTEHCQTCNGAGWQAYRCLSCNGTSQDRRTLKLRVKIPPRVEHGKCLRLARQAHTLVGIPGDILLEMIVDD